MAAKTGLKLSLAFDRRWSSGSLGWNMDDDAISYFMASNSVYGKYIELYLSLPHLF